MLSFSFVLFILYAIFYPFCNISLFLFNITEECKSASDCYTIYRRAFYGSMRCVKGFCKHLKDVKVMKFLHYV
ncbi:Nodule Cysteine-Rich (NCR) secreted peptide [Medicago truncatula]|uniref:Nodule Cysteine-Rich (NCR) secreted peptide n=1 Tax=Medicago truncatula TaxID=3880 RepID=A0A072TW61_MEDTR|nr:Nodule Cysteine-Rich (NCR) secreted peptide [Medicago truncatula]